MLLIADSGSTKTDWRLIRSNGEVMAYQTIGFNPYHVNSDQVLEHLRQNEGMVMTSAIVTQVFFYGAGCSSTEKCTVLLEPLRAFFYNANVVVEHDMLGAARAACGNDNGMVAILGTGSNSCLYDGKQIIENVAALGYVLGDYGSGVHIGKNFLQALLGKELPQQIEQFFQQEFDLTVIDILDAVYKQPFPNRFLASFSKFVFTHIELPEMRAIVMDCFDDFFITNICKYTDYQQQPLHLIGSVAYIYQDLIREVAAGYDVEIGKVLQQPIDELVNYHQ